MIKNYLLTAWRNLVKHKLNASILLIGLTVAFTCCILLFLMVRYEFSYDRWQTKTNRLYEAYERNEGPGGERRSETFAYPAARTMKAEIPSILHSTSFMSAGGAIRYKGKEVYQRLMLVDSDFFAMFSFPVVAGDALSPLAATDKVVINQTIATALFGKDGAVGKRVQVKISGELKSLTVAAVLRDVPANSSLQFGMLARIEVHKDYAAQKNDWGDHHHRVYVELAPGATQQQAEAGLREMIHRNNLSDSDFLKTEGYLRDRYGDYLSMRLMPLAEVHFDGVLGGRSSVDKSYLYTMMLIALIVMVIACFNFVNLNVVRSFTRAREVGVRKTIGAGRRDIYLQLWLESLLLFLLALLLSLVISALLLHPFNDLFTEKLRLSTLLEPAVLGTIAGATVLISFLAGGYPGWLVSRFHVVEVLKGRVSMRRNSFLRRGLITFQFVMAAALICSTCVIFRQFEHLRSASLGFEQESVISIPVQNGDRVQQDVRQMRLMLASRPQILAVSASSVNIGIGEDQARSKWTQGFFYKGRGMTTTRLTVDYDFLKVMGLKPAVGRDFSSAYPSDTAADVEDVIINQSMAQQLGINNTTGMTFYPDSSAPKWSVIGIVPDFHLYSLYESAGPMTISMVRPGRPLNYILVKVRTDNPAAAMHLVQTAFRKLEPDNPVNGSFLTENVQRWYEKEQRLANIFFTAAIVAILLSCLGLFAIVALMMEQRRKEIGIRKVLGASAPSVAGMLSREFLGLVGVAFLIAVPLSWYFLHRWLDNFLYKTSIAWWIFPLAGAAVLGIAMVTVGLQTMRAAAVNPVEALRSE
jgi:ABC-type antimicrobial peptide transport system permease subunit